MKVRAPDLGSKWRLYADNLLAPLCRKRNGSMTPKVHIYRIKWLFENWRRSVNEYFNLEVEWKNIVNDDAKRGDRFPLAVIFAYCSFFCFIVGITIGAFNYQELIKKENHVRQEISAAASTPNATRATTTRKSDQGGQKQGSPKQPAGSSPNKEEVKEGYDPNLGK